ncbi:transposable element Tcb1 transposase [Trichonephila clavipes]|nr:transposable element Tcb1 transposase [Trichonephila clavipes]
MHEGTTNRRDRSHSPQCTTSREDTQIVCMTVMDCSVTSRTVAQHIEFVTHHSVSARPIRRRLQQSGLSARRPLLALPFTQNHIRLHRQKCDEKRRIQRYISEVVEPVVLPKLQGLDTAIFQQDNARPHLANIVQRFFVNPQIELLPWPALSPDISPIENMWSMVAQRLTQITTPAAIPDQIWQRVEAALSDVPREHIQSLFESMPRRVAAVISNNFGYSGY